jgi:hypothetical protein
MINERIIDKIKKLIRHEQSARKIGSIAEAAAFAERIQQLLIENKLSLDQVNLSEDEKEKPGTQRVHTSAGNRGVYTSTPWWDRTLMTVVAKAHFCRSISVAGTNVIMVLGLEQDRAVTLAMFEFLRATMKRLARQEEQARKAARRSVRRFKPSFYEGFLAALHRRYQAMRASVDENQTTALVLAKSDKAVDELMNQHKTGERPAIARQGRVNTAAYYSGLRHGSEVDLSAKVLAETGAESRKAVGSGQ